jgi:hypothetical protein
MSVGNNIRLILKKINELNPFTGTVTGEEYIPIYDPVTGKTLRLKTSQVMGGEDKTLQWTSAETYEIGDIRTWNLKFWKSLTAANIGNVPTEGTYWTEVSKSEGNGYGYWTTGVFTIDPSIVVYGNQMYILNTGAGGVTMPYESTDFVAELAAGYWVLIGQGAQAAYWDVQHVTTSFTAVKNTVYIINATAAPVLATVPDVVAENRDEFRLILSQNTHKVTVTTAGGTQLISGATSQKIPTVGGMLYLKANGIDGYDIITDTRNMMHVEIQSTSREFTTDGFENDVLYVCTPAGDDLTMTLPAPTTPPGERSIAGQFLLAGEGTVTFVAPGYQIGGKEQQVLNFPNTSFTIVETGGAYYVTQDSRPKTVNTSLISYPLSEDSEITDPLTSTYFKQRCITIEDSRFSTTTPVESNGTITANPTDPFQLLGSSITDANVLSGEVPEGSISLFINIRRTGTDIDFQVKYFKRTSAAVESDICTSSIVRVASSTTVQLLTVAAHPAFVMDDGDRIIMRVYGRKATTGTNPTLYVSVEGPNPSRSVIEVAQNTITHNALPGRGADGAHPAAAITFSDDEDLQEKYDNGYFGSLISGTYSELTALITANGLIQGKRYLLTDYATKHVIPNSNPVVIHTGVTEPIILTAANDHEFYTRVISTIYPTDIIDYRFDDNSCEDGTRDAVNKKWTGGTARNGWITYRKSTTNLLSTHYDWRNYTIRRWMLDVPAWVSEGSYTKRQLVYYDYVYYIAKKTHSSETTIPSDDEINWLIYGSGDQMSYTPNLSTATLPFLSTGITIAGYQDFFTFAYFDTNPDDYYDIEIGKFDYEEFNNYFGFTELENNVFLIDAWSKYSHSCKIGNNSTANTFLSIITSSISDYCCFNIIEKCENSQLGSEFINNKISPNFYDNIIISTKCTGNVFSQFFYGNTINGNRIIINTLEIYTFYNNFLDKRFANNIIIGEFAGNDIGPDFKNNNTNCYQFINNIVIGEFQYNNVIAPISGIDFSSATHVYGDYNCAIFKNAAGTLRLSYYNTSDVLTIVSPTD